MWTKRECALTTIVVTISISIIVLLIEMHSISAESNHNRITDGTELVFSFLVFRHGDRTPLEDLLAFFSMQSETIEKLIAPIGYGQLTKGGKVRSYELGKFIRRRYNDLLPSVYNQSEVYIRSTDSTRAKMTVLTAMTAVFPATGDTWKEDINWIPIPYTTMPFVYDFNVAVFNCPILHTAVKRLMHGNSPAMAQYIDVLTKLTAITGIDLVQFSARTYELYDLFVSMINMGMDLGDETTELMPQLEKAVAEAAHIIFGNEDYIALNSGLLLKEFYDTASKVKSGKHTQKIRIYSGHDVNVYGLKAVTRVRPMQGQPKYGSVFSLELRRVVATGEYVVLPVYLSSPGEQEIYLEVEGCGQMLCEYQTFYNITSKYSMEVEEWREICGWDENMEIDTTSID